MMGFFYVGLCVFVFVMFKGGIYWLQWVVISATFVFLCVVDCSEREGNAKG